MEDYKFIKELDIFDETYFEIVSHLLNEVRKGKELLKEEVDYVIYDTSDFIEDNIYSLKEDLNCMKKNKRIITKSLNEDKKKIYDTILEDLEYIRLNLKTLKKVIKGVYKENKYGCLEYIFATLHSLKSASKIVNKNAVQMTSLYELSNIGVSCYNLEFASIDFQRQFIDEEIEYLKEEFLTKKKVKRI